MKALNNTRFIKKQIEGIRFSAGTLILILCCIFLIILSTFIQFDITHFIIPKSLFVKELDNSYLYTYKLIPQIPVILFVGAFLGRKYGIISILLYILLGLFIIPVFALGGGPSYVLEYGFGYILAYIPAVFFSGSILKSGFTNRNIIHAVIVGVLTIHVIGILYMLFIAGLKHEGWAFMQGWIYALIFLAKYAKIILWFYM